MLEDGIDEMIQLGVDVEILDQSDVVADLVRTSFASCALKGQGF